MSTFNVSVRVNENEFNHFPVKEAVYVYIRQLENAVKYPESKDALLKLYPSRFAYLTELEN